jgi:putative ABC transport system permease protein
MPRLLLFYRLLVRPLFRERLRSGLTVLAVALGVAVVLAIDLAGDAATGSFRSSMETLAGDSDLEVVAIGGVPETAVGLLAQLPYDLRISPRVEDFAVISDTKQTLPLIGVDLIAETGHYSQEIGVASRQNLAPASTDALLKNLSDPSSIWVGVSLKRNPGDQIRLTINDRERELTVRGVYPDSNGNESAILMDIAAAQNVLQRFGRVDRVLIHVPPTSKLEQWQKFISSALPPGVEVRPRGTGTIENRKMLAAFRWNLRLLSYIALIVGGFLIYNTISVSVVRRRPEIGIARALGASRNSVLVAFIGEAACFGLTGAILGLPLGRAMAAGAVKLMGATVDALYVSSTPGAIALTWNSVLLALTIGLGVAIASAYSPASEAAGVSPIEAMARGRREFTARMHKWRDLFFALVLGGAAGLASRAPAVGGKPMFGYLAAILLVASATFAIPALVDVVASGGSRFFGKILGVEALLASRSLAASLRRTSVLVAALSTAIAMMTAVGIMVGSFRQTVVTWMNGELPADLYIRPAGNPSTDRHPILPVDLPEKISQLPGVAAVDRLRAYEISYDGLPATLASIDIRAQRGSHESDFFSGRPAGQVFSELQEQNVVVVSEPFTSKHHVKAGDFITLSLGNARPQFRIADVYYDYSSERGNILIDRETLLKYLPDPAPSNIAVFVAPGVNPEAVRREILRAASDYRILIFSDREIRGQAIRIFDRTFAITYALEAVAVLVAVMGIAGALLALVIDRRRELGLLRFLGASTAQIRKLILVEAGLLGLLANFAGFALGFLLSLILVFVINKQSFGWTIHFHWPLAVLLGALTVVYAATVLAGLYPARVAERLNPIEVVVEE